MEDNVRTDKMMFFFIIGYVFTRMKFSKIVATVYMQLVNYRFSSVLVILCVCLIPLCTLQKYIYSLSFLFKKMLKEFVNMTLINKI